MKEEMENFHENQTWEIVKRPKRKTVIGCRWVFRKKLNADKEIERYKARLVARGFSQIPGQDFFETYSPVIRKKTLRLMLAIAVEKGWATAHIDVKCAYLNSRLTEELYMEQPVGFEELDPMRHVCRLKRSIYGLHQSGKLWNEEIDGKLKQMKYIASKLEPCLYYNSEKNILIGIYVDDLLAVGERRFLDEFKRKLRSVYAIKDLGEVSHQLSIEITRPYPDEVGLNQTNYTEEILTTFGMENSRPYATPLPLANSSSSLKAEEDETTKFNPTIYRKAMGYLLHLANNTRPDIAMQYIT